MIVLISGATHTGKTALAQRLTERYKIPYFSIDHLKMGLIRSGQTPLTVNDDEKLTPYLWSIVKEMVKTAIENRQGMIVEGCYIPFDCKNDFDDSYLQHIKHYCLVMTERYIENNFDDILRFENTIERRSCAGDINKNELIEENRRNFALCEKYGVERIIIDGSYCADIEL